MQNLKMTDQITGPENANTRKTLAIGDRQMGQPLSMAATVSAHVMQKREWPQGTRATPFRGAMRQTSHVADTTAALTVAAAVAVAGGSTTAGWSLVSSSSSLSASAA